MALKSAKPYTISSMKKNQHEEILLLKPKRGTAMGLAEMALSRAYLELYEDYVGTNYTDGGRQALFRKVKSDLSHYGKGNRQVTTVLRELQAVVDAYDNRTTSKDLNNYLHDLLTIGAFPNYGLPIPDP